MEELLEKILKYQQIYILKLEKSVSIDDFKGDLSGYRKLSSKAFSFLIGIPDLHDVINNIQQFRSKLSNKIFEVSKPENYLLRFKKEINEQDSNFYSFPFKGNNYILNKCVDLKIITKEEQIKEDYSQGFLYQADPPIHEAIIQFDEKIAQKIFEELDFFLHMLNRELYNTTINHIDRLLDKLAETVPVEEKIETTFLVPEMSLLLKLFNDCMKLKPQDKQDLFRMVAKNFTSKANKEISVNSVKNNFYTSDPNAKREIKKLLIKMQDTLSKM